MKAREAFFFSKYGRKSNNNQQTCTNIHTYYKNIPSPSAYKKYFSMSCFCIFCVWSIKIHSNLNVKTEEKNRF